MSKNKIKAAVMKSPGKIETEYFPFPELEPGSILLKMEMSGICGTDKHTYKGETKQYAGTERETNIDFPIIPGHENVGIIEEMNTMDGEKLDFFGQKLKKGDRITFSPDILCGKCYSCHHSFGYSWCDNIKTYGVSLNFHEAPYLFGGWAEYMYILPQTHIFKVPDGVSPEIAVLAELMACAYSIDKAKEFFSLPAEGFRFGDTVVIQGVGPLGLIHLIKSWMLGAGTIIAIDISDFRLEMAKDFGADYLLNVRKTSQDERINLIKDVTQGRGADMVVECTGIPSSVPEGIEMLRKGGIYIETGNFVETGEVSISPHRHLCSKNIRLIGMTNLAYIGFGPSLKMLEKYQNIFPIKKIVTHKFSINDADKAIKKSMELDSMKVVITPK
jgi:L-iditol 2-dehydrogenase